MTARLRLCFIVAPGEVGGLERVVHGLARGLSERGHDVHVIAVLSPEPADAPFLRPLRGSRAVIHAVRLPSGLRHVLEERRVVARLLDQIRPDIVHTHGYRPDLLDAGLARRRRIPIVSTIHGESFMGSRTALYEWLQWRAYRRFDAVIAVSTRLFETARQRGVPVERLVRIPNAWPGGVAFLSPQEARSALGLPADQVVIGWIGRMIPVKGADVFLEAFARIGRPALHACLIGDGRDRQELEQLARTLGVSERVTFAGAHEGAARFLPGFDAFVLSSRSEGTPIVLLEAMAAAQVIIATRVGGVPELVGDEAARLVPPEDPAALATAIEAALADSSAAARLARTARERVDAEYGTDRWLDAHAAAYYRLIEGVPS